MQNEAQYNEKHKDRLFRFIFKEKKDLLSLYNAINDSDYTDIDALQIYTMEDFIYMGMKNDLSFLLDMNLNVFEHQSTYNLNMPLRGFLYMAAALKKYIALNHLDIYSSKPVPIPIPRYFVFYNGTKKMPDMEILRLTDSMIGEDAETKSSAQFTAQMININAGHNAKIMQRCPKLHEYAQFIAEIRQNFQAGLSLSDGIEKAITFCINHDILADILHGNKAEVTEMLLKEYDEALHIANEKKISYDEGLLEGQHKEQENTKREAQRADNEAQRADVLASKLKGKTDIEIAQELNLPLEKVQELIRLSLYSS